MKTYFYRVPIHFLLLFLFLLSPLQSRIINADIENCNGEIYTDTRSGKKACILDGWKKETRNSNSSTGDYFYFENTDIFVTIDSHQYYDDLSDEDKKIYTRESFANYTISNSDVERSAVPTAESFAKQLGISATGSTLTFGEWKWGVMEQDFSPAGYDIKSTMYYRVIDGYFFGIIFDSTDSKSEVFAKSIVNDLCSQIVNLDTKTPSTSAEGDRIKTNEALMQALFAALKTVACSSVLFFLFKKVKGNLRKEAKKENKNADTITDDKNDESSVLADPVSTILEEGKTNIEISEQEEKKSNDNTHIIKRVVARKHESIVEQQEPITVLHEPVDETKYRIEKTAISVLQDNSNNSHHSKTASSSVVRFCRKCGTKLDADAIFCRKCGTKIRQ